MFGNFILSFMTFVLGTIAVLGVMALVAWITSLLESMDAGAAPVQASPIAQPLQRAAAPAPATPEASASEPEGTAISAPASAPEGWAASIDSNTVAVITAAVTAALSGRPFRIQKIQKSAPVSPIGTSSWAQVGRQSIHASHAIERKFR